MDEDLVLLFVGMFVGAVFVVILLGMTGQFDRDNELGGAICEEEYNMLFAYLSSFVIKVLYIKSICLDFLESLECVDLLYCHFGLHSHISCLNIVDGLCLTFSLPQKS